MSSLRKTVPYNISTRFKGYEFWNAGEKSISIQSQLLRPFTNALQVELQCYVLLYFINKMKNAQLTHSLTQTFLRHQLLEAVTRDFLRFFLQILEVLSPL